MVTENELQEHERRITKLETCVDTISNSLAKIQGSQSTVELVVKWVIVPLLVIVGGLVGIKIALP